MADQPFVPKPIPPSVPATPSELPSRPIAPPAGIPVRDTNLSNLSPSPAPMPLPPRPPAPPAPMPTPLPPRPVLPPPPPAPVFKSSVRTMEQDLSGSKPTPVAPTRPVPPPTPISRPSVTIPPPPSPKPSTSSVAVPPPMHGGSGKKWLIIAPLLIIVVGLLVWFLALRNSSNPKPTPTPSVISTATPTATPTPTPLAFQNIFRPETATIPTTFDAFIASQKLAVGELRAYNIQKSFIQFTADQKLTIPADVMAGINGNDFSFILFGKPDTTNSRGFAVRATDAAKVQSALTAWEPTMPTAFKTLFKINPARTASQTFLGNTYQGVPLRYRNFPDALSSIDYALITMPNSDVYLVLTNSRDLMFGVVDRVLGIGLGK